MKLMSSRQKCRREHTLDATRQSGSSRVSARTAPRPFIEVILRWQLTMDLNHGQARMTLAQCIVCQQVYHVR